MQTLPVFNNEDILELLEDSTAIQSNQVDVNSIIAACRITNQYSEDGQVFSKVQMVSLCPYKDQESALLEVTKQKLEPLTAEVLGYMTLTANGVKSSFEVTTW